MTRNHRKLSLLASVGATVMFAALLFPLAGTAFANHGFRVLDVEPETATRGVGATHTMTARLCEQNNFEAPPTCDDDPPDQSGGPVNIDFENENGPNDTDGTTRLTPDLTCSVPVGASTCEVSYVGTKTGTDTWRAWIDEDGLDATTEADTLEGRNEMQSPGIPDDECPGAFPEEGFTPEPDCTDVVSVTWGAGAPAQVDCDDANGPDTEHELNPSGSGPRSTERYTCFVKDQFGNPTADMDPETSGTQRASVRGENETPINDPDPEPEGASYESFDYSCQVGRPPSDNPPSSEVHGQCNINVTQSELETGTAEICFWVGDANGSALCNEETTEENQDSEGSDTGNDLADQVSKTWEARSSAEGSGGLDAEPETDTNDTGTEHSITATVYDQFGQAFQSTTVINFEFFQGSPADTDGNTPESPDETCTTNNSSSCSATYSATTPGRDLVCVWINNAPTMSGDSSNGTCNGEGLTDDDDTAGQADAAEPRGDDVDVVSKTWVAGDPAEKLDCEPETDRTPRGQTHSVECLATRGDANDPVPGTEVDVEATGVNDPDNGDSPKTPDFTCRTSDNGKCVVRHTTSRTGQLGTTTYRAWVDDDFENETAEADATEGTDEEGTPGDTEEPDKTDVVENEWIPNPNRSISIDSTRNSQERGKRVRIFGEINGDQACETAQTVRLRTRRANSSGGFRLLATTMTDNQGEYAFRVIIRRSRDYRTVARPTNNCEKARSKIITVRAT